MLYTIKFATLKSTAFTLPLCLLIFLSLWSCTNEPAPATERDFAAEADSLAQAYPIVDGHVDLPYRLRVKNFRLEREYLGIPIKTDEGDFDFERARAGGLDAPFMSIYIPSSYQKDGGAKELADTLINMIEGIAHAHPAKFRIVTTPDEIIANHQQGIVSLPLGMENGAPIEDKLENIQYFANRGIRYITLTHATDNLICDSSYDTTHTWNGLSPFGYDVVKEMNRTGIMVDISHVSDSTFYQVLRHTSVPTIASHSSARHFTPDFERNMSDDMIRKMGEHGGVIMVNFGTDFLDGKLRVRTDSLRDAMNAELEEQNFKVADSLQKAAFIESFKERNPYLFADVNTVADHIDHIVKLAGINHVGFGSDFDGVGDSLPTGLKDVSAYPNLIRVLLERGYSHSDIEKICSGNVFRVWRAVAAAAQ